MPINRCMGYKTKFMKYIVEISLSHYLSFLSIFLLDFICRNGRLNTACSGTVAKKKKERRRKVEEGDEENNNKGKRKYKKVELFLFCLQSS